MATAQQVLAQLAALAGENESKVGSNNTTVNKYFGAPGAAYCGYSLLYAFAKAGSKLLDGSGAANVGNLARFCEGKGWRVSTPQAGDIFVQRSGGYENGHTGFAWKNLGNGYFITLEGNYGAVKATAAQAENGTGSTFEGIGYRKQKITSDYKFYRPAYDGASSGGSTPAPAPTPTPRTADKAKVKEFQKFLGVAQDADPGPDTEKAALKKCCWACSRSARSGRATPATRWRSSRGSFTASATTRRASTRASAPAARQLSVSSRRTRA